MPIEIAGMGFVLAILAMITIIAVVVIWTARAKIVSMGEIAREEAYRKLAEETAAVQRQMADDLSELRARVSSMEKLLREVE